MKSIDEQLKFIFTNINDWLKFAEAKNGILIAFNGATIFGLLQSWESLNETVIPLVQYWFIPLLIISSIVSFSSFIPFLDIVEVLTTTKKTKKKGSSDDEKIDINTINVYYYGNIKDISPDDYLKTIYILNKMELTPQVNKMELDLVKQIIVNSRIAWKKYTAFKWAGVLTLGGVIIPIIIVGIKLLIQFILGK